MRKLGISAIAFALLTSGLVLSSATATAYETQINVELKKVSATSKTLTKSQLKTIKKSASDKDFYSTVYCWAYVGVDVTAKQKKNLHTLAKNVCKEVNKLTPNLIGGTQPTFEDEELGTTDVSVGFTIGGLRTVTYGGAGTDGDLPAASAPVKWNKKVTLAGIGNFENNGLEFLGWSKNWDGSGTLYQPGDKISLKRPINLYAKWDGYDVDVTVSYIGDIGLGHVGFNYFSTTGSAYTSELLGLVEDDVFEIGGTNGSSQIKFTAPGYVSANSLSVSGDLEITSFGNGTCGWALDYQAECTIWDIKATGDGSITYSMLPMD